jgi:hypothetical protein
MKAVETGKTVFHNTKPALHVKRIQYWSFLSFKGTPLSMSEICRRSGVPIEGKQKGEGQPFRGWKG